MPLLKFFFLLSFIAFSNLIVAQTSSLTDNSNSENINTEIPTFEGDNWTFYLDSQNKVYYIDFETISVNLSDVKVLDERGDTVLKDELWNLPVNTIYELNMADLQPGKYKVELRSYTGLITKNVLIAD